MQQITNKFLYGFMAGAMALALPFAADSASLDCVDRHGGSKQPETLAMHNEMMMFMQQGMLPPPPPGAMPPLFPFGEYPLPPFLLDLDLTGSQQDKIFELLHSQEPTMQEQQKAVRKAMEELNQLATSDHFNQAEVRARANKLAQALADTFVQHAASEAKLLALLTPEQRKQARQYARQIRSVP